MASVAPESSGPEGASVPLPSEAGSRIWSFGEPRGALEGSAGRQHQGIAAWSSSVHEMKMVR